MYIKSQGLFQQDGYFQSFLSTFEVSTIYEADGTALKIASSLKPNCHDQFLPE
jgi:hypothetical protein